MSNAQGGTPIDLTLGLSKPAQRALAGAGYTTLEQLNGASEAELLKLHGMGLKGIRVLREAMAAKGLAFAERSTG